MVRNNKAAIVTILALIAVLVVASFGPRAYESAQAQSVFPGVANNSFSASLAAASDVATITTEGRGGAAVVLTGTWVGTVTPQVSIDGGTTYVATQLYNLLTREVVDNTTANGSFMVLGVAGTSHVRVNMTAYTSGTATAVVRSTSGTWSPPAERGTTVIKDLTTNGGSTTVTIWTPASGKKVRIYGLSVSTTTDTTFTLGQGGTPTTIYAFHPSTAAGHSISFPGGFLVNTADATISMARGASTPMTGAIWGREE